MKVTEHEMRGLLAGKCVPADMLVNEELPAYLVRKFADLHSDIKNQETAYAQAVDSILMALKDKELVQDRLEDIEDKLQESREKLDAVLAENKILDGAIGAIADAYETGMADLLAKEIDTAVNIETPATDAILNEVRAEGVDMYAQSLRRKQEDAFNESEHRHTRLGRAAVSAEKFAAQLRSGSTEGGA